MTVQNTENKAEPVSEQPNISAPNMGQKKPDPIVEQKNEKPAAEEAKDNDPNWKAFREARKKDRIEKEAAEKRAADKEAEVTALKAAMEAAFSKSVPTPQAYQQYYGMQPTTDVEEPEGTQIKKQFDAMWAAKKEEERRDAMERERHEYPNRLQRDFPDLQNVCSQENIDYLDYHFPEVARPLGRLPEGYDKWHDIYHAVKKFIPNHANMHKDAAKADNNQMKPKSISSQTSTPPGQKNMETWQEIEQRRSANYERMQRIIKGV
jgi:hypothetical protein